MLFQPLTTLLPLFALATAAPSSPWTKFRYPAPLTFLATAKPSFSDNAHLPALEKRNLGGVRLSDGANFTQHVWYGIYPLSDCVGLGDYAHNLLSFRPDEGTYCLVMQGQCDGDAEYTEVHYDSPNIGNLGVYDFVGVLESYLCFDED